MERVLIVDDDPDILHLVSYNLKQAGFEAITADTGRKALETIQRRPPDLVILDLMLPDVDGMEVCRMLRSEEHTSELQSHHDLVCRLLLENKNLPNYQGVSAANTGHDLAGIGPHLDPECRKDHKTGLYDRLAPGRWTFYPASDQPTTRLHS